MDDINVVFNPITLLGHDLLDILMFLIHICYIMLFTKSKVNLPDA